MSLASIIQTEASKFQRQAAKPIQDAKKIYALGSAIANKFTSFGAEEPTPRGPELGDDLDGISKLGDVVQNWSWYCLMPLIEGQGLNPISLPWYFVPKATLPFRTIDTSSNLMNATQVHSVESYSVSDLSLDFFLDTSGAAQRYLSAWSSAILGNGDPSLVKNQGLWGLPSSYKKDISVVVLSASKQEVIEVKYVRCMPTDPNALDFNSDNATAMTQTVAFKVEDVLITVYDYMTTEAPPEDTGFSMNNLLKIVSNNSNPLDFLIRKSSTDPLLKLL